MANKFPQSKVRGIFFDEKTARETAALSWDRDHDPRAVSRQAVAVLRSGDRTDVLKQLQLPTLLIHGKADKMIDERSGVATARAIPNAKLVLLDGMGHSLPQPLWKEIANLIADHIHQAET